MDVISQVAPIIPELAVGVSALLLLVIGVYSGERSALNISRLAVILLLGVAVFTVYDPLNGRPGAAWLMGPNMLVVDSFSQVMKILSLGAAAFALYMAPGHLGRAGVLRLEYPVIIMLSCLGMMVMVSANSFLTLYVGLELQSLGLYVLAAFQRDAVKSSEAGLKYFVLGALSSGFLLYGISLFYGLTGTLDFSAIPQALQAVDNPLALKVALLFVLVGLAFKVTAVPFHMWAPDVYEGAPTPVTAFFSVAPKIAALGMLVRVLYGPLMGMTPDWQRALVFMSVASMAVGAFGALGQTNLKRLLAYSSIGHVGFMLMGLAAANRAGVESMVIYLFFYIIMSLVAFAVLLSMRRNGQMLEEVRDLAGLSRHRPGLALTMAIVMFSMAGIPPMVGFFTKVYVIMAAIQAGMMELAVAGVVLSVVSAFYYIRVIRVMYFDEPAAGYDRPAEAGVTFVLFTGGTLTLIGLAFITPISILAYYAANAFFP